MKNKELIISLIAMLSDDTGESAPTPMTQGLAENGSKIIVVLQRGWVVVGTWRQQGSSCMVLDSSVIRTWGTDKGLGQLALNGPTSKTKLDPCGNSSFHELGIVMVMPTKAELWS